MAAWAADRESRHDRRHRRRKMPRHDFEAEKKRLLADIDRGLELINTILRSPFAQQMTPIEEMTMHLQSMRKRVERLKAAP
jgi:hypothetical protein